MPITFESLKKSLLTIFVALVLGVIFFLAAGFAAGACHCSAPITLLFPYSAIALAASRDSLGGALTALQFPIYVIGVTRTRGNSRVGVLFVILVIHTVAAIVAWRFVH